MKPTNFSSCTTLNVLLLIALVFFVSRMAVPTVSPLGSFTPVYPQKPLYTRYNKTMPRCVTESNARAKSFLMVFMSRSGSTAISTELQQHPNVYIPRMEYLDVYPVAHDEPIKIANVTREYFNAGIAEGSAAGFKIRPHHILKHPELWHNITAEYETRIIWQYRKNLLKSAIGTYQRDILGDRTAIGGIKRDEMAGKDRCDMGLGCTFRLEKFDELHNIMSKRLIIERDIMESVNVLDNGRGCVMEVSYEDYLYHPRETMTDIMKYLGLPEIHHTSLRVKATSDNLCDVIENWDELCYNFYGCAVWQPYFEDYINDCRCRNFTLGPTKFCSTTPKRL